MAGLDSAMQADVFDLRPSKRFCRSGCRDRGRFCCLHFPPAICFVLSDIKDHCELFFLHLSMRANANIDNTEHWLMLAENACK